MKYTAQLLNDEEKQLIHQQSLRILQEVGIRCHGSKSLQILAENGSKIDNEKGIAYIPSDMIEYALASSPRAFSLGARNPKYNFPLPSPYTRFAMDGTGVFMVDFSTGERRYGEEQDIINALRVFQEADMGVMAWPPVCASDTPPKSRPLHEYFAMMKATSKHGQHELHTVNQVGYLVEGLEAVAGSAQALRENTPYSLIYCPVAPLTHDGPMLDAYLDLGQAGIPVMVMPMPVTGTTGPASLYSNAAMANAETLSSIVIFQLAHPGRPIIYSSAAGSINFRTGAYLAGTVEMGLQSAVLVQMGRYYGLPATCAGMASDAKEPGADAVLEKVITALPGVQSGSDIIVGFGEVESDQALYLEQILVDNEIAHICERLVEGILVSPESNLFDDIKTIGPGGHFLASKSTRFAARSGEFYTRKYSNNSTYEAWASLGRPSMYSHAREHVEEILSCPVVDPLPVDISDKLDAILRRADKELSDTKND